MTFWTDDVPALLVDFGVAAKLGTEQTVTGLFDREYVGTGEPAVDDFGPAFTLASADVTTHEIAIGSTLEVEGEDFVVRSVQPDGTGMTVLRLEAV